MTVAVGEIVGRERELTALRQFIASIDAPSALLLEGEAGIGKTTLWTEAVAAAHARSHRVLSCRPSWAETEFSYAALTDLLADVIDDTLPGLPRPQRRALEAALLLTEAEGAPPDQRAIGAALLGVLRTLAEIGPLVVAVDDVQWLDTPTAVVLEFAVRRLRDEPIGLLLTARVEAPEQVPLGLDRALAEESVRRVRLLPLSPGALHHVLRTRLDVSFPRPVLRRLWKASGGNPFFALELARALPVGTRLPAGEPLPVPEELVRERLAGLPRRVRNLLAVVAAVSDPTVSLLEAAGVVDALEDAIAAGVLETEGNRVRFVHPLLAAATYASAPPVERRSLHRKLGTLVSDFEERARHLALAADAPDASVAGALADAAGHALERGAPDAAADLWEFAVRLTPPTRGDELRRRKLELADCYLTVGDFGRSRILLDELVGEAASAGERADILLRIAIAQPAEFAGRLDAFEQALEHAAGDDARLADVNGCLGGLWLTQASVDRALAHARAALEHAERADIPALAARTLATVALLERYAGQVTPGLLERGLQLEETLATSPPFHTSPLAGFYTTPSAVLALRLMLADDLDDARARLAAIYAEATAEADEYACAAALLHLTELECRAGNYTAAAQHASAGVELSEQMGLDNARSGLRYAEALVAAYLGRVDEARSSAEAGLALASTTRSEIFRIQNVGVLGFVELSLGNARAAAGYLGPLAVTLDERGWRDPSVYGVLPNAIEALIAVGSLDEARQLLDRLEEQGAVLASAWALSHAARCRGLLTAGEGKLEQAFASFERALHEHERLTMPFERARVLLGLGATQRRAKQKRTARDSLETAAAAFEELGARLWAENARAELARVGGRAPASKELTATEERVAALVAEGRSNKEVAAALFVTPKTVEFHLKSVYAKLGVRSRTELARRLPASTPVGGGKD